MDESWRFRSVQSNICPTCSVSHFPFCPPPPAFDLNRFAGKNRYTPELNPPFHRPVHDPTFPDYRTAPPLPSPLPPVRDQFFHEEFLERENFRKRMRVDDPPLGNFMPLQPLNRPDYNPSRVFSDDERRLSLIRDHGQPNLASFGGAQRLNKDFQMDRYFLDNQQRSIGIDHSFHGSGLGSTGRNRPMLPPEPVLNHRNHTLQAGPILPPEPVLNHWNHPSQADAYEGYRNFTAAPNPSPEPVMNHRNHPLEAGPMLPPEPVSNHRNHPPQADAYEGYRNFATAPNPQIIDKFVPQEQKEFPRGEVFVPQVGEYRREQQHVQFGNSPQLPQSYGHGNPMGNSEHYAARAPEEPLIYNSRPQVSYSSSENVSQDLYEKYRGYDYQQFHHTEDSSYIPLKQPQNAHSGSYQPASNLENYEHESSHLRYAMGHHAENKFDSYHPQGVVSQSPFELKYSLPNDFHRPFQLPTYPGVEQSDARNIDKEGGFLPIPAGSSNLSLATVMPSQGYASQKYPPLPPQPSLAVHPEPPPSHFQATSFSPVGSAVSPVPASTLATMSLPPAPTFSEPPPSSQVNFFNDTPAHTSTGFFSEGSAFIHQTASKQYSEGGGHTFSLKHYLKDKATVIDACHLFKQPHRASRPDHIVIILRGLPGSGKSYLAKALRELEVENGGSAPRIHAMDDYFMIEVEKKVEDNEGSKSSSSFRGKKQITKKVIEYCYEPEMEEAYRSSMLKAFKKTLEEGIFKFIIVDDRNLRVADFAQFWAIAKRSGYEVYLLEATYKDPTGCAARNVHGFTLDDIQKMAEQWEEAPPLYLQLDTQSLFHGDDLNEDNIQEVDMDMEVSDCDEEETPKAQDRKDLQMNESKASDYVPDDFANFGDRWDTEEEDLTGVKELGRSKWSKDLDEDIEKSEGAQRNPNSLSGLIQAYGKGEKSVYWGDQVDKSGFSIGAAKKRSISSLIIGSGSGYNLNSNPLPEEEDAVEAIGRSNANESKSRFVEQLRAERESFRAVFDRRRQRIGGLYGAKDE